MVETRNSHSSVVANKANYMSVNGKQVLRQYFSRDQGKIVYAHIDPKGIGGVIYKPYAPNNSPYQQRTNKPDSYTDGSASQPETNNNSYRSNNSYSKNQSSFTLQATGQCDAYGRAIYRRVPIASVPINHVAAPSPSVQSPASDPLNFGNNNTLTLAPGKQATLSAEKNGAKLVIQNQTYLGMHGKTIPSYRQGASQSSKNIEIKRTPNRYGDYDYSIVHNKNGRRVEQKLQLPTNNLKYNKAGNNTRTYHIRSGGAQYEYLTFGYTDSKDKSINKPRASSKDLMPNYKALDLKSADSVMNIQPGASGIINIDGKQFKLTNQSDKQYAYIISRKQPDGSSKVFYRTDSKLDQDIKLDPLAFIQNHLNIEILN
jgi:hypothetical protein